MLSMVLKQIYRKPKYPLAIGIGIMLAVSMLVGTSIAVDNIANAVLQSKLNEIPVDFLLDKSITRPSALPTTSKLKSRLFKVQEIKSIEIAWHFKIANHILSRQPYEGNESDFASLLENTTEEDIISFTLLGVPSDFGDNVSGITWISGNISTAQNNSIAIPLNFANHYNLSVGDLIYLTALYRISVSYTHLTLPTKA